MKITVIGRGNVGGGLASLWREAGHEVQELGRDGGDASSAGVGPREAGLASGLLNTSQQVGGAIGVAIATSVAVSHTTHLLQTGSSQASAYTSGYALAFWVIAGISALGTLAALTLVKNEIPGEAQAAAAV